MAISTFKATCLEALRRVNKTRCPLVVTRNGEPIAMVVPPPAPRDGRSWLGALRNTGKVTGDVVAPAADPSDWEALR